MEDAPKLLKNPKSECPDIWIRLPRVYHDTNGQNHGPVWKTQSFLLSEISTVILQQDYYGKGNSRKSFWKFQIGSAYSFNREKRLFLSVYVDDNKMARKKQNLDPMWKILMKGFDLGEPTSFVDHVYLGCTQWDCKINKDIMDNYRDLFECRMSAGGNWKLPCSEAHIVLKCLYLARFGRPDFLWSVNKLARAVAKRTRTCDKRSARLISYIRNTNEYRQYCDVETQTAQQWRPWRLKNQHRVEPYAFSEVTRVCQLVGCARKKTSGWRSSTEAEINSLDAGLRMDGIPALTLWDLVMEVFHSSPNQLTQQQQQSRSEKPVA